MAAAVTVKHMSSLKQQLPSCWRTIYGMLLIWPSRQIQDAVPNLFYLQHQKYPDEGNADLIWHDPPETWLKCVCLIDALGSFKVFVEGRRHGHEKAGKATREGQVHHRIAHGLDDGCFLHVVCSCIHIGA